MSLSKATGICIGLSVQGATAGYPKAVILAVAHDSSAVCIVQHGAGAALFDCDIASGVGCSHGVPLISSQPAFAVARLGCALLHLAFFFSSLMSCSCNSGAAYGGKSASSARGGEPRRSSTCAQCCGGFFGHSPLVRSFNLRCVSYSPSVFPATARANHASQRSRLRPVMVSR